MEDNRLEIQLTKIQRFVNHCVMQTFNVLIGNILRKKECIGSMLLKKMLQKEFLQITDKLSSIYMKYPSLSCVEESYNENNFLWDSIFYESLNKEQKGKYSNFNLATFEYTKYVENNTLYDGDLPMFSSLIDAILYEHYTYYLRNEIEKIELRVGKIVKCEKHPKADKLLVSQIKLGSEMRQIVSGIAEWYKPEEMVGKNVIVVCNLKPVKLRGVESQGMILAAGDDGDDLVIPEAIGAKDGAEVR